MFSFLKRPFGSPNAVIYSYELSKLFLDEGLGSLLEVGCGIGIFAFRYASSHRNTVVTGVDHSARTVEFLTCKYGRYYENLELRNCDFCEQGLFLGNTFDAVYSSDVLEHVTDTQAFVDNIHRHLRAGGKAVVNFPNETSHGINHFKEVDDARRLFAAFSDVKIFVVSINHPVNRFWFAARAFYETLFSRSSRDARKHLYSDREEQGIDCFEESTCFKFASNKGKGVNLMASILAEAFLMIKPRIDVRQMSHGNILNSPRLVVAAKK
jgi:SAM-dependent methyltransferase